MDRPGRLVKSRTLSSKSHTSEPEPEHFLHELPSTQSKIYKPISLYAPDRIRIDTEHKTCSRPPCCWHLTCPSILGEEVHRLFIACVHRDIQKDLTLSAEEHRHPLTPHLVVFAIEVWRTRTPFLVCHPWILDWLESIKSRNRL
jgi:hypothetical protein